MGKGIYHQPPPAQAPQDRTPGPNDGKADVYYNREPGQNFPTGVQGVNEGSPWPTPGIQHKKEP